MGGRHQRRLGASREVTRDLLLMSRFCRKIGERATPETAVSGFAKSDKASVQPHLGVAVLKRKLCNCGEGGLAKNCTLSDFCKAEGTSSSAILERLTIHG
jgi:hypothetical protein